MPNVILTDIMMPSGRQAGLRLVSEVKANEQWKHIPIIVLSARTDSSDILDALERGAMDYLIKPYQAESLFARIERAYELSVLLNRPKSKENSEHSTVPQILLRKTMAETMSYAILAWELGVQKSKIELAEMSGLWTAYMDKHGTYSTKTLDRYLHSGTLPKKTKNAIDSTNRALCQRALRR